ncbi:hypothetical protein Tco_1034609 [Tanacetum coccineum]
MIKEGIVLGHKISKNGIEVDKAKVDVIAKLPHPTTVKGVRSFLGHAGAVVGTVVGIMANKITRAVDVPTLSSDESDEIEMTEKSHDLHKQQFI